MGAPGATSRGFKALFEQIARRRPSLTPPYERTCPPGPRQPDITPLCLATATTATAASRFRLLTGAPSQTRCTRLRHASSHRLAVATDETQHWVATARSTCGLTL